MGGRIRAARQARKLTQEQLAEMADATPTYISQIERNMRTPSIWMLSRLADALDVSMGWILDEPAKVVKEGDMQELLEGCSVVERLIILDVAAATKKTIRKHAV